MRTCSMAGPYQESVAAGRHRRPSRIVITTRLAPSPIYQLATAEAHQRTPADQGTSFLQRVDESAPRVGAPTLSATRWRFNAWSVPSLIRR